MNGLPQVGGGRETLFVNYRHDGASNSGGLWLALYFSPPHYGGGSRVLWILESFLCPAKKGRESPHTTTPPSFALILSQRACLRVFLTKNFINSSGEVVLLFSFSSLPLLALAF